MIYSDFSRIICTYLCVYVCLVLYNLITSIAYYKHHHSQDIEYFHHRIPHAIS